MLALRKRRWTGTIPFLRGGFRPFFFGAATWGLIAIALWLCALAGAFVLPTKFDPVAWHRHEMLFGFSFSFLTSPSASILKASAFSTSFQ